jgi:hypothetical protein
MIRSPMPRSGPIKKRSRRKPTSMIRSDAVTQSARDQDCTLQIAGFQCAPNETVVLAHIPMMGNHGAGLKADDVCGCYACATCHALLDGRMDGLTKDSADWYFYALRGLARTLRAMYDAGILTIKGASK